MKADSKWYFELEEAWKEIRIPEIEVQLLSLQEVVTTTPSSKIIVALERANIVN